MTRHAESIIGVMKFRRNAGAGSAPAGLDVMPPGAAARCPPFAAVRPRWVAFGRFGVIARMIPIAAPLVHVLTDIVEAERVGRILRYPLGAFFQRFS